MVPLLKTRYLGDGKAVDSVMGTPEIQSSATDTEFGPSETRFAPSAIHSPLPQQKLGQPVKLDMAHQGLLFRLWTSCLVRTIKPSAPVLADIARMPSTRRWTKPILRTSSKAFDTPLFPHICYEMKQGGGPFDSPSRPRSIEQHLEM